MSLNLDPDIVRSGPRLHSTCSKQHGGSASSSADVTRIILRPLSALSLDEGLNALNGKNPSAAVWFSRPIKCQILARMRINYHFFRL